MNLLMSTAVIGAIAINEWFEAATVAFLFSLSLLLESWSVGQARRAIHSLLNLSPPIARVIGAQGEITETPPHDVPVGETLQVRAGDKIPLDGVVQSGASDVDQSAITGESVPVEKNVGDPLFAGTINGDGVLTMQTTRLSDDSAVAKIVRLVSEAGSKRAASEQWVEKFAAVYTPIVFALALLILFVPPLVFAASWSDWIYRALVLLVIACPCALVISTPVSVVAALTSAARRGVLIKGGVFIEVPAHLDAIAFDKTGTLTQGTPAVAHCVLLPGTRSNASRDRDELLEIAAALATASTHPLSRAIHDYADKHNTRPLTALDVTSVPGKGTIAQINGTTVWLGSKRFLNDKQIDSSDVDVHLASDEYRDQSVVLIGDSQRVLGFFTLSDPLREHAAETVSLLRKSGIATISMLTGDRESTAQAIADQIGIDDVHSQLLPEDKVEVIGLMVQEYGRVAMVGDGINDAPALAIASLGIAMGGAGTDVAMETADITFMSDDLRLLPWLCSHSKRTLRIIRQNIVLALSIKFVFVLLTIFGMASLWAAIAADTGASLLVIFNALRLLHTDDPH
jgi:Cd2+/Zn2+-exporting ATPase